MRKKREKPTMANVRIADYERWLDEVMRDNVNRVRRQRGGSSGSGSGGGEKSDEAMKARTVTFFHAVATIRLTLMKYRQEGRPDFPE